MLKILRPVSMLMMVGAGFLAAHLLEPFKVSDGTTIAAILVPALAGLFSGIIIGLDVRK